MVAQGEPSREVGVAKRAGEVSPSLEEEEEKAGLWVESQPGPHPMPWLDNAILSSVPSCRAMNRLQTCR